MKKQEQSIVPLIVASFISVTAIFVWWMFYQKPFIEQTNSYNTYVAQTQIATTTQTPTQLEDQAHTVEIAKPQASKKNTIFADSTLRVLFNLLQKTVYFLIPST